MKVTLLNTYLTGGAGIASRRLFQALKSFNEAEVRMIVQDKSNNPSIFSTIDTPIKKLTAKIRLTQDLIRFILHEKKPSDRFQFSPGMHGLDISQFREIKQTDIIHLHWINQGFLSLRSIEKLSESDKPVIWTLHDMWAFTGGCHYSGECIRYESECQYCPYLKDASSDDLSSIIWKKKKSIYNSGKSKITFVTCSNWLKGLAENSGLLGNHKVVSIPNPIDTNKFKPIDKITARKRFNLPEHKKLILFGAMNLDDPRKGFNFFLKGLEELYLKYPDLRNKVELVSFGKTTQVINHQYPIHHLGKIYSEDDLTLAYSSADIFVLPSLQDNLPNTIMESMACGTPVVAFETGGIPEMIDHLKNGYLAKYKSSSDLAEGINYLITHPVNEEARKKVLNNFAQDLIASKYIQLYKEVLQKL